MKTVTSSKVVAERETRGRAAKTLTHLVTLECGHEQEWSKAGKAGWQPPRRVKCGCE